MASAVPPDPALDEQLYPEVEGYDDDDDIVAKTIFIPAFKRHHQQVSPSRHEQKEQDIRQVQAESLERLPYLSLIEGFDV